MSHAWLPTSPCGDGCLPRGRRPRVLLRRAARLGAAAAVLLAGALALPALLATTGPARRERVLRGWLRLLVGALRVRVRVLGGARFAPPGAPVLVVSNHVSWLDALVLGAVQPVRLVAKAEVATWPLISRLARCGRTVFVDRERLTTLPATVAEVAGALRAGSAVGAFPEGTTWCGLTAGRFRPALFEAAVRTGAPVRPVAVHYALPGVPLATAAAFVGPATLWSSLVRVAGLDGLVATVALLPVLPPGADRRALAAAAERAVTAAGPLRVALDHLDPAHAEHDRRPGTQRCGSRTAGCRDGDHGSVPLGVAA